MTKIIISLIGYGGSGKSSSAEYLKENFNFSTFTFSNVIREYAKEQNIVLRKRADFANTLAEIIKEYGLDYMLTIALNTKSNRICIDDLKLLPYAEIIHKLGGKTIAFDCPAETRFSHVRNHLDVAKYPTTLRDFLKNEHEDDAAILGKNLKFETTLLMKEADYHIDASKTLEDTFNQLENIVRPLCK